MTVMIPTSMLYLAFFVVRTQRSGKLYASASEVYCLPCRDDLRFQLSAESAGWYVMRRFCTA